MLLDLGKLIEKDSKVVRGQHMKLGCAFSLHSYMLTNYDSIWTRC